MKWEVSQDEAFTKIVQQGSVVAGPQLGHSIHVELHGLDPHNWYYFRFHAGVEVSRWGVLVLHQPWTRCRRKMKFAFTSCQHFEVGYFNGYPHMQRGRPRPRGYPSWAITFMNMPEWISG